MSALDAHVGKAVFSNVLQDNLSGKTRILVTHALHFLPQVDYIYTIVDGRIAEQGTYSDLMKYGGEFSKFVKEFGSKEETTEKEDIEESEKMVKRKMAKPSTGLMQVEERNTGAISGKVYRTYLKAGRGAIVLPFLFLSVVFIQAATVMSSYW